MLRPYCTELQTEELCALQAIYADDCQVDTVGRTAQVYIPHAKHVPSCVLTILMPDSYPSSSPPVAQLHATHLSDDVCQAACAHLQQLWAPGEVVVHTWVEWLKEQRHLFTVGGQPEAALADSHGAMEKEEEEGEEGGWNPEHEGEDEEQRQDHGGVIGVAQCSARLGGCRGPVEGQLTQSRPRAKQGAAAEVAFLLESVRSRIVSGLPVTERKSTFQAHVAKVDSAQEAQAMVTALLENNKIRGATHNIMAYRIPSSHVGNFHTDCDDDGETAAGGRLLHLLQKHEDSARHKQNLAAKQKSSAAVQAFKAALTTGRDRAAAKRKEQMEDPATVTQFAAVFYLLKLGRPMTDIEHTPDLFRVARTPAIAAKHWKDDSAWQIAEALYSVMRKHDLEVLQSATFLSLSLDEATTVDNRAVMCVHGYVVKDFTRRPVFLYLKEVLESPTADELFKVLLSVLDDTGLPRALWQRGLVALGTDGASVMVGSHNGLAIKVRKQLAPFSSSQHCAAHRVSLSASVMDKNPCVMQLTRLVDVLNRHFCKSASRTEQYKRVSKQLGHKGQLPGRAVPTRWLSLSQPLQTLTANIRGLVAYMADAEGSVAEGITAQLTDLDDNRQL